MKKIIIGALIGLVVLLVVIGLGVRFFLDSAVKKGIETVGPMLTKVDVKLDSVTLSLLSGSGKLKGLIIGNPEGYKTPSAIQVGEARLALQPGSIFSDKVVIHSVSVVAPQVTFETDLKGNNLSKILANLQAASGGAGGDAKTDKTAAKANKKLQVDDFLIRDAKLNVSVAGLGKSVTVPLPEIHLTGLGTGPDGITVADLTKKVIQAIEKEAVQASGSAVSGLAKDAANLTKDAGKTATQAAEKLGQGIGGLLKKK